MQLDGSGSAAGKVVVGHLRHTNTVFIAVGHLDDQHQRILQQAVCLATGGEPDLDGPFCFKQGGDFFIDSETGGVSISGMSVSFGKALSPKWRPIAEQAIAGEVRRVKEKIPPAGNQRYK